MPTLDSFSSYTNYKFAVAVITSDILHWATVISKKVPKFVDLMNHLEVKLKAMDPIQSLGWLSMSSLIALGLLLQQFAQPDL